MNKNIVLAILLTILQIVFVYCLFAFVVWTYNPAQWSEDVRFIFALCGVITPFTAAAIIGIIDL